MKKRVVILGGMGNGADIADVVRDVELAGGEWTLMGFLNDRAARGELIHGAPVLGPLEMALELLKQPDVHFIQGLMTVKKIPERIARLESLGIPVDRFASLIHPTAVASKSSHLGFGSVVMPLGNISAGVNIGNHVMVWGPSIIAHDSSLGNYVDIAPGAIVGSYVNIDQGAFIGLGAVIREKLMIGKYAIVGMGSVVIRDVKEGSTVVGNPAKEI